MASADLLIIFRQDHHIHQFLAKDVPYFESFVANLEGKFPWMKDCYKSFTFELNLNQKCSLHNDADYTNMILLCNVLQRNVVYVSLSPGATPLVPVTLPQSPISPPAQCHTIPQFFPQTKPNTPLPAKRKRGPIPRTGTQVPEYLFDGNIYPENPTILTTRQKLKHRNTKGSWYPGAQTQMPSFDMAPEEEPVVPRSAQWAFYITHVGQEFYGGMREFRAKLVKFSAKVGFRFVYTKNDATYVRAECKQKEAEGCEWYTNINCHRY